MSATSGPAEAPLGPTRRFGAQGAVAFLLLERVKFIRLIETNQRLLSAPDLPTTPPLVQGNRDGT